MTTGTRYANLQVTNFPWSNPAHEADQDTSGSTVKNVGPDDVHLQLHMAFISQASAREQLCSQNAGTGNHIKMFFQAKLTFLITGPLCQVTDNETESKNQVPNQNYRSTLLTDVHFVTTHGGGE